MLMVPVLRWPPDVWRHRIVDEETAVQAAYAARKARTSSHKPRTYAVSGILHPNVPNATESVCGSWGSMARVLVVEDDPVIADMLAFVLTQAAHDVALVGDGQGGIDRAISDHPDLIFMDIMLPTISGIAAARTLRAFPDAAIASTPIIAMSAGANLATVTDTRCFSAVLPKPFDIETVIELVALHAKTPRA